jgi:hypothetical protein
MVGVAASGREGVELRSMDNGGRLSLHKHLPGSIWDVVRSAAFGVYRVDGWVGILRGWLNSLLLGLVHGLHGGHRLQGVDGGIGSVRTGA